MAVKAAGGAGAVPLHRFSGTVEHALAHIEELALHKLPEDQQRWYAIKLFERDEKIIAQLGLEKALVDHMENDIRACEEELDDDAESIITAQRYEWIGSIIHDCCRRKSQGRLSVSDKIDRIVTNRILALPIFVVVMGLVYALAMAPPPPLSLTAAEGNGASASAPSAPTGPTTCSLGRSSPAGSTRCWAPSMWRRAAGSTP